MDALAQPMLSMGYMVCGNGWCQQHYPSCRFCDLGVLNKHTKGLSKYGILCRFRTMQCIHQINGLASRRPYGMERRRREHATFGAERVRDLGRVPTQQVRER